jgi:hypothetical protein
MNGSLWVYDPKKNESGERVYGEMNTGDAWKQADSYFRQRIDDLLYSGKQTDKRHFLVLVNAFIDNTLSDLLGRLPIEPVLFSLANILEKKRRSPDAWVLAGILPAYPKSVSFVLPTVKSGTASFPNSLDPAKWYIVMPPRSDWQKLGWPNRL